MKIINLTLAIVAFVFLVSCEYHSEEELYGIAPCDTSNVSYFQHIEPIIESNCNSCHSAASMQGNIITEGYDQLKTLVDIGSLWGAVNHEPAYSPMPQNAPQLTACKLKQIRAWIDAGAPNN